MTDLDIEFEHLWLELSAQRWVMVERFLFNYYCFREGYLSKQGKPDWETARLSAAKADGCTSIKHAELEPIVPLTVIIGELKRYERDGELNRQSARRVLDSLLDFTVITKQQKQTLRQLGLADSMPKEWYTSATRDPYARFAIAGIQRP